MRCVRI